MKIGEIENFGIWDSKNVFSGLEKSERRIVNYFEMEFIISGNGTIFVDDIPCKNVSKMFLIAKPGQARYSYYHFKTYYIHINIDKSFEYYDILNDAPNFFKIINSREYEQIITQLITYLANNNADTDDIYFNSKFLELLYLIKKDTPKNINLISDDKLNEINPEFLHNIVKYIDEHYSDKITLKQLSEIAKYSPNYFHMLFTKTMGLTPNEYIMSLRIEKSKQMLLNSKLSIAEIAYNCGFSSQAYFSSIFKRTTSITPKEYKSNVFEKYKP